MNLVRPAIENELKSHNDINSGKTKKLILEIEVHIYTYYRPSFLYRNGKYVFTNDTS